MSRHRLCFRLTAACVLAVASLGAAASGVPGVLASIPTCGSGPAIGNECTYIYTAPGSVQDFVPPPGVTSVTVHAIGGAGGGEYPGDNAGSPNDSKGGAGADVQVSGLSVTPGSVYSVNVGGNGLQGFSGGVCDNSALAGGYNGGGSANVCGPGTGGGASVLSSDDPATAAGVLVVAGGGGGGGELGTSGGNGAAANTADGGSANNCVGTGTGGGGGTTTTAGAGGSGNVIVPGTDGGFLQGGTGADALHQGYGAGGGAGYFGGGGGGANERLPDPCGAGGGAGSSYAASGVATYAPDATGVPGIQISWSPTVAAAAGLRVVVARGWTTMTWRSTAHVLGFNVYRGSQRLNRVLVGSTSHYFSFRLHEVVRHPLLRAVRAR
jgi:hypothetical protein